MTILTRKFNIFKEKWFFLKKEILRSESVKKNSESVKNMSFESHLNILHFLTLFKNFKSKIKY